MNELDKVLEYLRGRWMYCTEQQQYLYSGDDVQRIKCCQAKVSEINHIREFVENLKRSGNL